MNYQFWLIFVLVSAFEVSSRDAADEVSFIVEEITDEIIDHIDLLSDRTTDDILSNTQAVREFYLDTKLSETIFSIIKRYEELKTEIAESGVNIDICTKNINLDVSRFIDSVIETADVCVDAYSRRVREFEKIATEKFLSFSTDAANLVSKVKLCSDDSFCKQVAFSELITFQKSLEKNVERKTLIIDKAFDLRFTEFAKCVKTEVETWVGYLTEYVDAASYCYSILK